MQNNGIKMRAIITGLLFIMSFPPYAQDVFIDKSSQKEYLFLGSIKDKQLKVLGIKEQVIRWIDRDLLEQTDRLNPESFSKKIFEYKLEFISSGDEPFWSAKINQNKLTFLDPTTLNGKAKEYDISLDTVNNLVTYSYVSMFKSKDSSVYGLIREKTRDLPCELSLNDEVSIFEIFINYKGEVFKGCAYIGSQ